MSNSDDLFDALEEGLETGATGDPCVKKLSFGLSSENPSRLAHTHSSEQSQCLHVWGERFVNLISVCPAILAALCALLPEAERDFVFFNSSSGHIWVKVGAPSSAVSKPPAKPRQWDEEGV